MAQAAGKTGKVTMRSDKGDVVVKFGEQYWVFNPSSCSPAPPGCPVDHIPMEGLEGVFKKMMEGFHKEPPRGLGGQLAGEVGASSPALTALCSALAAPDLDRATLLLQQEPGLVKESSSEGVTALHLAAGQGQVEALRLLVAKGASLDKGDKHDNAPLHRAVHSRSAEAARALLELGAEVNLSNEEGRTPLHLAVSLNCTQAVRLLLQHRASVNRKDIRGDTPLHDALHKDDGDPLLTDALLEVEDLDLTVANKNGFNPLHLAAQKDRQRAVAKILARDPQLTTTVNQEDFTALHIAALNNHVDIMELLLQTNAPINVKNNIGQTPLHLVCSENYCEAGKLLLENGADVHVKDKLQNTPLHSCFRVNPLCAMFGLDASTQGDRGEELASCLLRRGARTDVRNREGKTPLEIAPADVRGRLEDVIRQMRSQQSRQPKNQNADDTNMAPHSAAASPSCVTCHQREADVIFLPCAHKLVCRQCAGSAKVCPTCGKDIERKIDTEGRTLGGETTTGQGGGAGGDVQQECKVQ